MTPSMGRQALYGCLVAGALSAESGSLILNRFILSGNLVLMLFLQHNVC